MQYRSVLKNPPQDEVLSGFERGASRVRSAFAKRIKFFEAKHADTFNASDSRQSHQTPHKKANDFCHWLFYLVIGKDKNTVFFSDCKFTELFKLPNF